MNSSPPLISWKFQGFGGIWATSGKIQEISRKFRGTQWNSVGLCMALSMNSVAIPGGISGQRRIFGNMWGLEWFRAIWGVKRLLRK